MSVMYPEHFWTDQYTHQIHKVDKFSKFVPPDTLKMYSLSGCLFLYFFENIV